VSRATVVDTLRPEEERLIEQRAVLEVLCVPPVLAAHLGSLQAALAALQGQQPTGVLACFCC
jgi:hypothetical protein